VETNHRPEQCWLCEEVETSTLYEVSLSTEGRIAVLARWLIENPKGDGDEIELAIAGLARMRSWIPETSIDPEALRAVLKGFLATGQRPEEYTEDPCSADLLDNSLPRSTVRGGEEIIDRVTREALWAATDCIERGVLGPNTRHAHITKWEHVTDDDGTQASWKRQMHAYRFFTERRMVRKQPPFSSWSS